MSFLRKINRRKVPLSEKLNNIKITFVKFYKYSRKPIIIAVSLILLIFISFKTYAYLNTSPYFKLLSLEILGTETLTIPEVERACKLQEGKTDLLFLSASVIAKKCEKHPWINNVKIIKKLPNEIVVIVKEEKAAAITSYDGMYLTNIYGEFFIRLEPPEYYDLPWITGIEEIIETEGAEAGITAIKEALSLINDYSKNRLEEYDKIHEVHVDQLTGMSIFLADTGLKIVIGSTPFTKKIKKLPMILDELSKNDQKAEYVLLNNKKNSNLVTIKFNSN